MSLKNKVAIVTGGNSGIGQAIVLELARCLAPSGKNILILERGDWLKRGRRIRSGSAGIVVTLTQLLN
jgi:NAD(P)-dependent dehydrogenase (short-subunit alcohol dehydrogenase family)